MQEENHPVEAVRVREHMKKLLEDVNVKTACAVGIVNLFKGRTRLEHPRFFLQAGHVYHELPSYARRNMAATAVFGKSTFSLRGTSGLMSYDISGSELMVVVLWMLPYSLSPIFDNRFAVVLTKQQELTESLYYDLIGSKSRKPDDEITQELDDFFVRGTMTNGSKATILVECRNKGDSGGGGGEEVASAAAGELEEEEEEEKPKQAQQLQAGHQLQERIHQWLRETEVKCACAIGVNNYTGHYELSMPQMYIDTGRCEFAPPDKTEGNMAAPALFTKTQYSLRGCSGVITWNVGEHHKLAVFFLVPLSETMHNNIFAVRILPFDTTTDSQLFQILRAGAQQAKDGEIKRREPDGFEVEANMETDARCALLVNLKHH